MVGDEHNNNNLGGLLRSENYIYFRNTEEPRIDDLGGKGYGLAKLQNAGFNVPKFFIITTSALEKFLESNNSSLDNLYKYKEDLSYKIMGMKFPDDLRSSIIGTYKDMFGNEPVAVRSSATIEDTEKDSMAGRFETILNANESNMLDSVKKVYCSLVKICKDSGINSSMAVVVQKQVFPKKSGVAFVDNEKTVINAVIGHPGLLVSGMESGDTCVIDNGGKYSSIYKPQKRLTINGDNTEDIPKIISTKQKISKFEAIEIASTSKKVMESLGKPQDIEWCFANNELFILQARPITKTVDIPKGSSSIGLLPVSIGIAEGIPWSKVDQIPENDVILTVPYLELSDADKLVNNPNIKGIITEFGGMLSHEAILAREKGIPYLAGFRSPSAILAGVSHLKLDTQKISIIADGKEMIISEPESYMWLDKNFDNLHNIPYKNNDYGLLIRNIGRFIIVYRDIKTKEDMENVEHAIKDCNAFGNDFILVFETNDRTLTAMRMLNINPLNSEPLIYSNLKSMEKAVSEFNVELLNKAYSKSKRDFFSCAEQSIKDYELYKGSKTDENLKKVSKSVLMAEGAYRAIRSMTDYYEYSLGNLITKNEGRLITDIELYKLKTKYEEKYPNIKETSLKLQEILEDVDRSQYTNAGNQSSYTDIAKNVLSDLQKKLSEDKFKRTILYLD